MMEFLMVTLSWILQPSPMTELTISVLAPISVCLPITQRSEMVELICLRRSLLRYLLKVATLYASEKMGKSTTNGAHRLWMISC